MIGSLLKSLLGQAAAGDATPRAPAVLRLHVGGEQPHPDWKILNIAAGPHVDYTGTAADLTRFADGSIAEIYASHVLEHLDYREELPRALAGMHRALVPGGRLLASVPDLDTLARLFCDRSLPFEERYHVMRMMFGGQMDAYDFHKVGLSEDILVAYLRDAGFAAIERVERFGLFEDASALVYRGVPVSLNVIATKAPPPSGR